MMRTYFVNQIPNIDTLFISRSRIITKYSKVVAIIKAKPTTKKPTNTFGIGAVGYDWKGNKIEITKIIMTLSQDDLKAIKNLIEDSIKPLQGQIAQLSEDVRKVLK